MNSGFRPARKSPQAAGRAHARNRPTFKVQNPRKHEQEGIRPDADEKVSPISTRHNENRLVSIQLLRRGASKTVAAVASIAILRREARTGGFDEQVPAGEGVLRAWKARKIPNKLQIFRRRSLKTCSSLSSCL